MYDQDATRQRVMELLGNELAGHVDENSLVFVYFAGHGETETLPGGSKKGYILPWDADDDFFATGIPMDAVQDLSNRMTAKHVMYAIDACYSGISKTRGIRVPERNDKRLPPEDHEEARRPALRRWQGGRGAGAAEWAEPLLQLPDAGHPWGRRTSTATGR